MQQLSRAVTTQLTPATRLDNHSTLDTQPAGQHQPVDNVNYWTTPATVYSSSWTSSATGKQPQLDTEPSGEHQLLENDSTGQFKLPITVLSDYRL
jgi:hypothetical protein